MDENALQPAQVCCRLTATAMAVWLIPRVRSIPTGAGRTSMPQTDI